MQCICPGKACLYCTVYNTVVSMCMYGISTEDMVLLIVSHRPFTCILDFVKRAAAQHGTAQHGTAQHGTAEHSTAQHSTAQHSTAPHLPHLHQRVCLSPEPVGYAPTHCPLLWHSAWGPLWPETLPCTHVLCMQWNQDFCVLFCCIYMRVDITGHHSL